MVVNKGEPVRVGGADLGIVIGVESDDNKVIVRTYDERTSRHYTISYFEEDVASY